MSEHESVMEHFGEWAHLRHHGHQDSTTDQPQENRMSRITEAKNAIDHASQQLAAMAANPLADAIADAGIGHSFTPKDVQLALAMISAIDKYGPGVQPVEPTPGVTFTTTTPPPATQVQPQQPA